MTTRIGESLFLACIASGDPGFERVLRRVDIKTLRETKAATLSEPIRAMTAAPGGMLLATVGNRIVQFDDSLQERAEVLRFGSGPLTLQDIQSAYALVPLGI